MNDENLNNNGSVENTSSATPVEENVQPTTQSEPVIEQPVSQPEPVVESTPTEQPVRDENSQKLLDGLNSTASNVGSEVSATVDNTVEAVSKGVNDAANYVKNNKKTVIIIGVIAGIVLLLIIVILFISSLTSKNDLVGTYGCYKLENSWRNYYEEVIIINKNGTWKLGDYEDLDTDYLAGTYKSKKLAGSKKGILDVSLEIKEDVENGKSSKDSGVIGVYVGKMKNGKYDFTYKDGSTMICEKGIKLNKNDQSTTAKTTETTTTTSPAQQGPEPEVDGDFLMSVEDVFSISGRGVVVTGKVLRGKVKVNDVVDIIGLDMDNKSAVQSIEAFKKQLDYAVEGDNVGILLSGLQRNQIERGQVISKPDSIASHKKAKCSVHVLSKEEGGRHTPFYNDYKPQFYFRTADVTGNVTLPEGTTEVNPGDDVEFTFELEKGLAMEVGTEFSIREGGRTVGKGKVTEIIE